MNVKLRKINAMTTPPVRIPKGLTIVHARVDMKEMDLTALVGFLRNVIRRSLYI